MASSTQCDGAVELYALTPTESSCTVGGNEPIITTLSNTNSDATEIACSHNNDQLEPTTQPNDIASSAVSVQNGHNTPQSVDNGANSEPSEWFRFKIVTRRTNACIITLLTLATVWWAYASWHEARRANYLAELAYIEAFRDDCRAQNQSRGFLTAQCSEALEKPLPPPKWSGLFRRQIRMKDSLLLEWCDRSKFLYLLLITPFMCIIYTWLKRALVNGANQFAQPSSRRFFQNRQITSPPASWVHTAIPRLATNVTLLPSNTLIGAPSTNETSPLHGSKVTTSSNHDILPGFCEYEDAAFISTSVLIVANTSHLRHRRNLDSHTFPNGECAVEDNQNALVPTPSSRIRDEEKYSVILNTEELGRAKTEDQPETTISPISSDLAHPVTFQLSTFISLLDEYLMERSYKVIRASNYDKLNVIGDKHTVRYFLGQAFYHANEAREHRDAVNGYHSHRSLLKALALNESARYLCELIEAKDRYKSIATQARDMLGIRTRVELVSEVLEDVSFRGIKFPTTKNGVNVLLRRGLIPWDADVRRRCIRCLLKAGRQSHSACKAWSDLDLRDAQALEEDVGFPHIDSVDKLLPLPFWDRHSIAQLREIDLAGATIPPDMKSGLDRKKQMEIEEGYTFVRVIFL